MTHTLVAFHAHPDDEALLTSGTLARAAAEGHRVVVVVATDGDLGLASRRRMPADGRLGARRLEELRRSASVLGVARVVYLGYADSGLGPELLPDPAGPGPVRQRPARGGRRSGSPTSCARSRRRRAAHLRPQRRLRAPRPRPRARGRRAGGTTSRARRACSRRRSRATPSRAPSTSPRRSTASRRSSTGRRSAAPSAPASEITHRIRRAPVCRREAGLDARPRLPVERRGRRRTAPWRRSCGSRARCTTWCSGASGSSTPRGQPGCPCRTTSSRACRERRRDHGRPRRRTRHPAATVTACGRSCRGCSGWGWRRSCWSGACPTSARPRGRRSGRC